MGWSTCITSIRDSLSVGDMGGVIGAMDRESFLAIEWKRLGPLSGRGATGGKEAERGVGNMAVLERQEGGEGSSCERWRVWAFAATEVSIIARRGGGGEGGEGK